ncbi:fumarate/nitrate reduction transcriptional regulator Fnr [Gallionella capsiferriformans]|uniref:Transcriptional regulator, Crp/Fnr family n=1 Tax=Gallionella capsiferriformans (strain ES-2) TaxID=395494 RepID=D9SJ40_GALCS|nr:fumarate/nitrate reduction transcriptional regulator Fnr [Gallionella capsiferriformans]ADL54316.1 transcriptional regulator, Crp/Fnr family [Gallionella capsiferriformans ES-2]
MPLPAPIYHLHSPCSSCNLAELCLPADLSANEMHKLDELSTVKRSFARSDYLYRSGDKFRSLFAIHSGSFKTQILHEDGREQVTGFQMAGEIIGLDAISTDIHACDAVALESCVVCELPFNKLEALSREIPLLQRHLHKIMSREIVRDQGIMLLLGSMRAEERLAVFLLNLSQRFAARGLSPTQFQLRMSRQEIGSYLGLKLETVSRAFSHFQSERLINVKVRTVEILDLAGLQACLNNTR